MRKPSAYCLLICCFILSCTSPSIIRPAVSPPPSEKQQPAMTTIPAVSEMTAEEIDFGDAFDSVNASDSEFFAVETISDTSPGERFFRVPSQKVRIALSRNVRRTVLYSVGKVAVHSRKGKHHRVFRGRCAITAHRKKRKIRISTGKETIEALLPCTLQSQSEYNFIEFEEKTWRGMVLLVAGKKGTFSVVNYLDVEEYLKGVVPLEIGKRPREEIEALKAQAVAARTYTYRRIIERRKEPYDMVATVADQVYGGASVENRESDFAVKATKNLIMTYGDSIIDAYYHSTCGGITADVNEAWGKPRQPYLRSVSDFDESGKAYCRASKYFTWKERWPWRQFSSIVVGSLKKMYPGEPVRGVVNSIVVRDRFPCGRVKQLTFTGSGWSRKCGGDETRFILRRGVKGHPILRSANFTIDASDKHTITLKGRGYGHGVGMCQMGAIGRAQAGQQYTAILRVYYPGISIVSITTLEDK